MSAKTLAKKSNYSLKIGERTIVCDGCTIIGTVTLGERCVIHPKATIIADAGPIIMGNGNLVEEQAVIHNKVTADMPPGSEQTMIIGNNNVFEVASYTECLKMGDNNTVEPKARVGRDTSLGNSCIVGAMCELTTNEVIPDKTVIYGKNCERRIQLEDPAPQTLQIDFLSKLLPNYHYMIKSRGPIK